MNVMYFELFCIEHDLQKHHFPLHWKIRVSAFELLGKETRSSICVMTERDVFLQCTNENSLQR